MFDRTINSSWDERSRFGLTTFTSFTLQVLAVGILLILPLLHMPSLPFVRPLSTPISLGRPLSEPIAVRTRAGVARTESDPSEIVWRAPSRIPVTISATSDEAPPAIGGGAAVIPGSGTQGDTRGLPNLFSNSGPILPALRHSPTEIRLRISHISEGNLIRKVQPLYPPLARSARIQGTVVLQAIISKQGSIENLKVLSGHPMLVSAAIDAVRQWRYQPYILNNEPVEVETQVTVNFSLAGN